MDCVLKFEVVQSFTWIEGGELDVTLEWTGGKCVVYTAGMCVLLDEDDLHGIHHCLKATNVQGERVLGDLRRTLEAPAQVSPRIDWSPERLDFFDRAVVERGACASRPALRRRGRLRRTTTFDLAVKLFYDVAERCARMAHDENSRKPRDFGRVATEEVTRRFGTPARTVQRVIRTFRGPTRTRVGRAQDVPGNCGGRTLGP